MKSPLLRIIPIAILLMMIGNTARAASGDAFLNASNFASLGAFNPFTNVVVDLSSGKMSGGASFIGVTSTQAGTPILVFTFSSFNLNSGVTITFANDGSGSRAVAFLSQGDMTITGSILGNGHDGAKGGPSGGNSNSGPGAGGPGVPYSESVPYDGGSITATVIAGGGGGGYGGAGGGGGNDGSGGASYNSDLSSQLLGGSGGGLGAGASFAGGPPGPGGGGGGALQIGALGAMTISGAISADGGQGRSIGSGGGGGGSGGGILIHADNVTIDVGAIISATGGAGGGSGAIEAPFVFGDNGGGGGGGRIQISYRDSGVNNGSVNVTSGGGADGTIVFGQSSLVPSGIIPGAALIIISPTLAGQIFTVSLQSEPNVSYTLQTKSSLAESNWIEIATVTGNGSSINLSNPSSNAPIRFYRIRASQ